MSGWGGGFGVRKGKFDPPFFHHCPPNPWAPSHLSFPTLMSATNAHSLKNCFNQIHFPIDLNVFINITTHMWSSLHYHDVSTTVSVTNAATNWIMTLTFIVIPTAIMIDCLIGFSIVFDSERLYTTTSNHVDTLLEKVNLIQFTMDLTLS